ncbi:MAG: glycosyltransferase [Vicinamibacterales bacterium]
MPWHPRWTGASGSGPRQHRSSEPEKGHADLIDALAIVAARGRRVSTVLAGDGPSRPDLERRIQAAGLQDDVHLPGYVSQPARLLQDADLMVLPSHTEGLPNAALEALAMDVPVLATRVGGTPEVITDGETGRLVEARAPEQMAAAILEFLDDPARWTRWALAGKAFVEANFDFRARTRKLEDLYVEMMEKRGSR